MRNPSALDPIPAHDDVAALHLAAHDARGIDQRPTPNRASGDVEQLTTRPDLDTVRLDADRRLARLTLALMLVPTVWFLRTDLTFEATELFAARFVVRGLFLALLVGGVLGLGRPMSRNAYERLLLFLGVGTALCIFALNALRPQGSTLPLRTPMMWLLVYYGGLHSRVALQIVPPLLVSVGLTVLRLFWVDSGAAGTVDGDIVVIWVVNVLGVLMVRNRAAMIAGEQALWESRQRAHEARERAMVELRTLQGIIPICSYCREVRTAVGDWTKLESYVQANSEADFSHGICPDCLSERFPDHGS